MGQPILEVEHLKKSYVNNVPILDDVSFSLQKGEVVVIVGPSGCGKSTFLRCINRLEEIDTGVLKLNGVSYEKEKKNIKEASKFYLSRLSTLLLDMLLMQIFVIRLKFNDKIIKLIVQFVVIVLNYVLSKFLVFKSKVKNNE